VALEERVAATRPLRRTRGLAARVRIAEDARPAQVLSSLPGGERRSPRARERHANSLWLQIGALTHNLVRSFQLALGAPRRTNGWKRTYRYVFESLQTLRFTLIQQPARIVRPGGRPELRFAVSDATRRRIEHVQRRIALAA